MKIAHRTKIIGLLLTVGLFVALHFAHAQATADTGSAVMTDSNEDVSNLSDLAVELKALEMATPIAASNEPSVGNFYSAQHAPGSAEEWPPMPGNIFGLPVWPLDTNIFVIDDLGFRYNESSAKTSKTANNIGAEDDFVVPSPPGGGSDTNTYNPPVLTDLMPDYGTNLFIVSLGMVSGNLTGVASNTLADVEYAVQTNSDLITTNWADDGQFILGSDATNWTQFILPPPLLTNNLFFRLQSQASSDGSGIPDWWELKYFGTNGINVYADPEGDGWTILRTYINGLNPTNSYAPPVVQGVYASSSGSRNIILNWSAPEVTPVNFTIQEDAGSGWSTIATVAGNVTSYTVSSPPAGASFQISANYPNGSSAYASAGSPGNIDASLTLSATIAAGSNGQLFLLTATPSTSVTGLVVTASPDPNDDFPKDGIDSVASQYPYTDFTTRNYAVNATIGSSVLQGTPLEISTNFAPIYGWYDFSMQTLGTNGFQGNVVQPVWWADATPFLDGRQHMLDNLNFSLRAASVSQSFDFYFPANLYSSAGTCYGIFPNYTTAGFSWAFANNDEVLDRNDILDPFLPFENDSVLRAFCFDTSQFDSSGNPVDVGFDGDFATLPTMNTWDYYFNALAYVQSGNTNLPARQIDSGTAQYIFSEAVNDGDDAPDLGMTWDATIPGWRLDSNLKNVYGLPVLSVLCVKSSQTSEPLTYYTAAPGGIIPEMGTTSNPGSGWLYVEAANPVFQKIGFHFVPEAYASPALTGPGWSDWTGVPNTNSLLASVGNQSFFYLWTQLAVSNANPGTISYLQDYFDKAYQIDTNGLVTTNQTGVLSEYGNFFPTAPGPVALVTKPDLATGQTCTGIVQVVSLALDANRDGTIDPSFYGADYTSSSKPYVFWCNNNFDRYAFDTDDGTNYMDDVQAAGCPFTPNTTTPDYDYRDSYGNRIIPDTRDLEDFSRLWVCGVNSNLLANLPAGSTITLSWGDVGNPNSANPTIDLFQAVDPDGGMGYLTNETTATKQINPTYSSYIGRVEPGQSVQLNSSFFSGWAGNHFIWCGVTNGTGGLTLTVADGSGNVLAQSTVYIQIKDIKQMYERWTVGEDLSSAPMANAVPAIDGLPSGTPAFTYPAPENANTPYILFVHGWNLETWDKDRFAETAFKRLYWQGYQGRFGFFRWPTGNQFTGDFSQLLSDPTEKDNYDGSEYNASLSGQGLLNKLTDLNAKYPGNVYLLAHSMGNVVAGEALRLAGNDQVVNTYVASQAALSAHEYDATTPDYSFTRSVPLGPIMINYSFGPVTPDIYINWFADNNGDGTGRVISFYNTNDYALNANGWQFDQLLKPDGLVAESDSVWNYGYSGSTNDPAPWNNFFKTNDYTGARVNFDIVNIVTNRYEVMAYAAQSYTTALGATPNIHNVAKNVDLTDQANGIWPLDPTGNDYTEHFWHSAEFRGDNVMMQGYWNYLLGAQAFGLK